MPQISSMYKINCIEKLILEDHLVSYNLSLKYERARPSVSRLTARFWKMSM